jgi:hypothetical protein
LQEDNKNSWFRSQQCVSNITSSLCLTGKLPDAVPAQLYTAEPHTQNSKCLHPVHMLMLVVHPECGALVWPMQVAMVTGSMQDDMLHTRALKTHNGSHHLMFRLDSTSTLSMASTTYKSPIASQNHVSRPLPCFGNPHTTCLACATQDRKISKPHRSLFRRLWQQPEPAVTV